MSNIKAPGRRPARLKSHGSKAKGELVGHLTKVKVSFCAGDAVSELHWGVLNDVLGHYVEDCYTSVVLRLLRSKEKAENGHHGLINKIINQVNHYFNITQ